MTSLIEFTISAKTLDGPNGFIILKLFSLPRAMTLEKQLSEKRSRIIKRWLALTLETYPEDTQRFLKKRKDRFANPVGTTLSDEIEKLYDAFIHSADVETVSPILENIIKIRAIQDFTPSQAVAFVFLLKGVIRSEMDQEIRDRLTTKEWFELESRIDTLALLAFDVYGKCREVIFQIRTNEVKNHVSRLLQRAGLVVDMTDQEKENTNATP